MASSDSVDYNEEALKYLKDKNFGGGPAPWDLINKRTGTPILETSRTDKYLRPYLNDQIVVDVIERVKTRADKGMQKYGVPMTRPDITTIEWLRHAQEEALDLAVYLERCIRDLKESNHG